MNLGFVAPKWASVEVLNFQGKFQLIRNRLNRVICSIRPQAPHFSIGDDGDPGDGGDDDDGDLRENNILSEIYEMVEEPKKKKKPQQREPQALRGDRQVLRGTQMFEELYDMLPPEQPRQRQPRDPAASRAHRLQADRSDSADAEEAGPVVDNADDSDMEQKEDIEDTIAEQNNFLEILGTHRELVEHDVNAHAEHCAAVEAEMDSKGFYDKEVAIRQPTVGGSSSSSSTWHPAGTFAVASSSSSSTTPLAASGLAPAVPPVAAPEAEAPVLVEDEKGFVRIRGQSQKLGLCTMWGSSVSAKCLRPDHPKCTRPYSFRQLTAWEGPSPLHEWLLAGWQMKDSTTATHMGLPKLPTLPPPKRKKASPA